MTLVWFPVYFCACLEVKVVKSRQVVFSLFLKVDNKSCHSWEENHSNIILNKDADASNRPVYIDLNSSDCLCTDTWWQKNMRISCAITRNVLYTFLACARLTVNVCCLSVDNLCKQFGLRSGLTKSRAWSGSELFDNHSDGIPQKLFERSLF